MSLNHITILYCTCDMLPFLYFKVSLTFCSFLFCSFWHAMHFIFIGVYFAYHVGLDVILCTRKQKPHQTNLKYITVIFLVQNQKYVYNFFFNMSQQLLCNFKVQRMIFLRYLVNLCSGKNEVFNVKHKPSIIYILTLTIRPR